ncbi:MAG: ferrochelatase [Haliscomenobacter sp.]|nr:ferrochelatase [Haliscomenobacter sp.]
MPQPTTGVLLVNLGTPDTPTRSAVYRYLKQFLLDPRVIDYPWLPRNLLVRGIIAPFRSGSSSRLYQRLWTENGSPLKFYGERLAAGLQQALGETYAVELGMRYQNPSVESAVDRLMQRQVQRIVVLPLFPQYASATTGSVHEEVMRILKQKQVIPELVLVNSYYDYDPMIRLFAENARQFQLDSYDHVIFSYHGLPQRQLRKADAFNHCLQTSGCCQCITPANQFCYSAQCHATTAAIVAQLELPEGSYTTTFQSRLGPEKWAQPYTSEVLDGLAANGAKRVLVFSPAFVADCLETLVEIGYEYQHRFEEKGGEKVDLVPSLNDHPEWIQAVKTLVLRYAK